MREALKLKPLCTSYLFSAALLGAILVLIALLPTVANAQAGPPEQVTICHRPGTPAEQTKMIPSTALDDHLDHGDTEGPCDGEGDTCPCAASGSARKLHKLFLRQEFDSAPATHFCSIVLNDTGVHRWDGQEFNEPLFAVGVGNLAGDDVFSCFYYLADGEGENIIDVFVPNLQLGEVEACREDIIKLMAKLDDCPTP